MTKRDDTALRLAQARQWIAHQGVGYLPSWDQLTAAEREQAEIEALDDDGDRA